MIPINIKTLMGHSTGISDSYYRPTENDLLEHYLKVVDHLTIKGESKLKTQVEEIKERDHIHADAIAILSDQVMKLKEELDKLKKEINKSNILFYYYWHSITESRRLVRIHWRTIPLFSIIIIFLN
jgi:hypothetical protein